MNKIGRYEVVGELGRGAMGVVYKASDPTIGRLVAIKVVSLDSSSDPGVPGAQDIFMREARAAGRLSHPGIVTIHDALEDPETKHNYIVMEFVPGRTLEDVLLFGPPLTTDQALDITRQIAEALVYAHEHQIIHRDLKPANILLTEDGRAKITDFGIAKIMAASGSIRTTTVMGTPAYMSPEQVTGAQVDARSDLFALGILLYLMLAGEKPFAGDTAAVMFKIVYEDPVPPSRLRPELSTGHDYLVLRSLVKDPNKRYGSAREFLDDLDDVQHGRPPRSETKFPLAEIRQGERTLVAGGPHPPWRQQMAPAQLKTLNWTSAGMGAAGVFFVALLVSGVLFYRSRNQPSATLTVSQPAASGARGASAPSGGGTATNTAASPHPSLPQDDKADLNLTGKAAGTEAGANSQGAKIASGETPGASQTLSGANKIKSVKGSAAAVLGRVVQLICKFQLDSAALTVSGDQGVILQAALKGKKKIKFLSLKSGFVGILTRPITIPAETHNISVQVLSTDGTVDLSATLPLRNSATQATALLVDVRPDALNLRWGHSSRR